jgi:hypothetical protein
VKDKPLPPHRLTPSRLISGEPFGPITVNYNSHQNPITTNRAAVAIAGRPVS